MYDVTVLTIELIMDYRDTLGVPVFTVPADKLAELQLKHKDAAPPISR